jgi:hypothetical protein
MPVSSRIYSDLGLTKLRVQAYVAWLSEQFLCKFRVINGRILLRHSLRERKPTLEPENPESGIILICTIAAISKGQK